MRGVLAAAVLIGVSVGSAVALGEISAERYAAHGLLGLALSRWVAAVLACLALSLASALPASLLSWLAGRAGDRTGAALEVAAWWVLCLPVGVEVGLRGGWFASGSGLAVLVGYAALAVALAVLSQFAKRQGAAAAALRVAVSNAALILGLVFLGLFVFERLPPTGVSGRPNVLLIVLDTVRVDRLSAYGYPRATTPELDSFAAESIRFDRFYATSSWTVPSHASLFTGHYAIDHGATQEHIWLRREFATLAEILANAGYETWAASANPLMGRASNLTQGFRGFVETWRGRRFAPSGNGPHPVNEAFVDFLAGSDRERPFFAFLNYMDAHDPHTPPQPFLGRFIDSSVDPADAIKLGNRGWKEHYAGAPFSQAELDILSDLYDAGLAYLSTEVGRLLEIARREGLYDDTLIVITSDHGEHFGENGLVGHFFSLYNTAVRVPLMIHLPAGARAGEIDRRKGQLVDLFATILDAAGVDPGRFAHGAVDLLSQQDGNGRQSIFSEYYYPDQVLSLLSADGQGQHSSLVAPFERRLRAVERYGFRFIWSSDGRHELYNVAEDPGETADLFPPDRRSRSEDEFLRLLERELAVYVPDPDAALGDRKAGEAAARELDAETLDALRAVGYVD